MIFEIDFPSFLFLLGSYFRQLEKKIRIPFLFGTEKMQSNFAIKFKLLSALKQKE